MSISTAKTYVNRATSAGTKPEDTIQLLAKAIEEIIKEVRRLRA